MPIPCSARAIGIAELCRDQRALPGAGNKVLPGIGVSSNESELSADQVIEQIDIARQQGAPGFVLFDLSHTLRSEILPVLTL